MNFTAKFLFTEFDGSCVKAGLADDQFETKQYVLFERSLKPSEQDKRLGLDRPHYEICDQSISGFGGIKKILLDEKQVVILFEDNLIPDVESVSVNLAILDDINILASSLDLIFEGLFVDLRII